MLRWYACCLLVCTASITAGAGELAIESIDELKIYTLRQGETVAQLAPEAGANLFSIRVGGVELLRQPKSLAELPGVAYGTPVLYPMPNRVKDARFSFEGQEVRFEPNAGSHFIHGLVNRHPWEVVSWESDDAGVAVRCKADFGAESDLGRQFPFPHQFYLTIRLADRRVRWTYEVDNRDGQASVPFGFALHPYFVYQDSRDSTWLTIPASHWMEAERQLPSGKLIAASELDYPLGSPFSLQDRAFDDVFWGLRPERPTRIEFRGNDQQILIHASQDFTHLVVWTPNRPYFGVESQTCSTDAHNLHAAGFEEAAHLQVCLPGQRQTGWVEYRLDGFPRQSP